TLHDALPISTIGTRPAQALRNVVLPAPFGPWTSTTSPAATSRATPARAGKRPRRETAAWRWPATLSMECTRLPGGPKIDPSAPRLPRRRRSRAVASSAMGVRRVVAGVGRALIVLGVLILLFVAY